MPVEKDERLRHEVEHGKLLATDGQKNWMQDSWVGRYRIRRRAGMFARKADIRHGHRVLEVGFGTGSYTETLLDIGASVTGIDISPDLKSLAEARLVGKGEFELLVGDAEELTEVSDGSFDAAVGNGILHHLDAERCLRSIFRKLKPGGRIAFAEPNMLNPQVALQKNVPFIKRAMGESPDETAYFRWQMTRMLKRAGYVEIDVRPIDFLHPWLSDGSGKALLSALEYLERVPVLREIAGALLISARKPLER